MHTEIRASNSASVGQSPNNKKYYWIEKTKDSKKNCMKIVNIWNVWTLNTLILVLNLKFWIRFRQIFQCVKKHTQPFQCQWFMHISQIMFNVLSLYQLWARTVREKNWWFNVHNKINSNKFNVAFILLNFGIVDRYVLVGYFHSLLQHDIFEWHDCSWQIDAILKFTKNTEKSLNLMNFPPDVCKNGVCTINDRDRKNDMDTHIPTKSQWSPMHS